MSAFTSNLQYVNTDRGLYKVLNTVRFYLRDDKRGEYIEIYKGIRTNFATIPKWLWWLVPNNHEDLRMAAAFHDPLVNEHGQQIEIQLDHAPQLTEITRTPSWFESAMWFREMVKVRQEQTRKKHNKVKKLLNSISDFLLRWIFWGLIVAHGIISGQL